VSAAAYAVTPLARADLEEAVAWIAADDSRAAERFLQAAEAAFETLAERPGLGHRRRDLTSRDVRFWPIRVRHLVVYRETSPLQILRVLSAYRDVAAILSEVDER
jgi:plasmid stabilization system protein ParE